MVRVANGAGVVLRPNSSLAGVLESSDFASGGKGGSRAHIPAFSEARGSHFPPKRLRSNTAANPTARAHLSNQSLPISNRVSGLAFWKFDDQRLARKIPLRSQKNQNLRAQRRPSSQLSPPRGTPRPLGPRSSNLRVRQTFTDREKDRFFHSRECRRREHRDRTNSNQSGY
jgi:hypothetical protein